MRSSDKTCFICGNDRFSDSEGYIKCVKCGHETIKGNGQSPFIINDILSEEAVRTIGSLDRFKQRILQRCLIENDFLLDVGSASGKFLYHNKAFFRRHMGIEVTDECADFARERLGLNIERDISGINGEISVATFWHSLEHIPVEEIGKIFKGINSNSSENTRVIISVPNNRSLQYALFKEGYAYYDLPSHLHQFSSGSLDLLMDKYGFEKVDSFYSFPYSIFGYLQGFLNKFNAIHNYLYYRKKRGWAFGKKKSELILYDIYNYLLSLFFVIPSFLLCIYDLARPERGGVITACYRKKRD